jgi:type VI secretion system secreted protein VgrG
MGWTGKKHQRARLRRRPQLELLDDRCLLSTGGAIKLFEHGAAPALDYHHTLIRHTHHQLHVPSEKIAYRSAGHHAAARLLVERPAGSIETGATTAYDPITAAAATRSAYNVDGTGMTVAVIDTGVDYKNPALGGNFGPGAKVIAGYDFADGTGDPMATASQHGTAIAGLIGSSDPADLGVAPGVKIVALRVTNSSNVASLDNIANALQWVITNHSQYNITSVNMSLADGGNYAQNWFASDGGSGQRVTQLIGQLTAMNIPVIAATGNSFNGMQGEGFAAIVAGTISVTATDLSGNLLSNAQRLGTAIGGASATTIAAPGDGLTAPSGDSGTATLEGTSFAAALTTGGVTLLQEIYQSRFGSLPTVAQIKSWLQGGATTINDPVTGISLGDLNILKSASLIPVPAPAPAPAPVQAPTPAPAPPVAPVVSIPAATSAPVNVQVYVNGQQVGSSSSTSSTSLSQGLFARLLQAMTGWWAGPATNTTTIFGGSQVQIWNA